MEKESTSCEEPDLSRQAQVVKLMTTLELSRRKLESELGALYPGIRIELRAKKIILPSYEFQESLKRSELYDMENGDKCLVANHGAQIWPERGECSRVYSQYKFI